MSDMMEENKERKGLKRDTTMCGTPSGMVSNEKFA